MSLSPLPILKLVCRLLICKTKGRQEETERATSANSEQKGVEPMKNRKHNHVALALEDYIDFWKKQAAKLDEELKESKQYNFLDICSDGL